jgi:hypothetical protein
MASWHQLNAGVSMPDPEKYCLVSDGLHQMRTSMSFGSGEGAKERAFRSLKNHIKNQPHLSHFVYFGGRIIA